MAATASSPAHLGFLSVVQEQAGFLGGLLITNAWGRPVEFRLSTPVQPNRVQQILYGPTLQRYICADVIGKTLIEKSAAAAQAIIVDQADLLDVRLHLEVPVVYLAGSEAQSHPQYAQDTATVNALLKRWASTIDLAEPFSRIREALAEARKLGVTKQAA